MLNSPQFLEQMSSVFSNPQIMDQIMAMNPQVRGMDPQMRQMFQSDRFRQMMCVVFHFPHSLTSWTDAHAFRSNPETLRTMLQMSSLMNEMGAGPTRGDGPGGLGGLSGLSGLGGLGGMANPTTTPDQSTNASATSQTPGTTGSTNPAGTTAGSPPLNPFFNPAFMQQLLASGGPGGGGGLGGVFGAPSTPADTRPAEERFQTQLEVSFPQESKYCVFIDILDPSQQLNSMGFVNASQNIRALQATGGNVHAAVEYILGGGGL